MSLPAQADSLYVPQIIPQCALYSSTDGEVCGYLDIEDWKRVLEADAELALARGKLKNQGDKVEKLTLQVDVLQGQLSRYRSWSDTLYERVESLNRQLVELDAKYQAARAKSAFGSPLPWAIAVVSVSVLVGVGLSSL